MRLAIVVGHDFVRQGAVGVCSDSDGTKRHGLSEWEANCRLGDQIARIGCQRGYQVRAWQHTPMSIGGVEIDPTDHRPQGAHSYSRTVGPTFEAVNRWQPDAMIELHFNAVPERNAEGLRMRAWDAAFAYYWPGSTVGQALAASVSRACAQVLGSGDLGAMPRRDSWAGAPLRGLRDVKGPAILLETHNGKNYRAHAAFRHALNTGALAGEILRAAASTLE